MFSFACRVPIMLVGNKNDLHMERYVQTHCCTGSHANLHAVSTWGQQQNTIALAIFVSLLISLQKHLHI